MNIASVRHSLERDAGGFLVANPSLWSECGGSLLVDDLLARARKQPESDSERSLEDAKQFTSSTDKNMDQRKNKINHWESPKNQPDHKMAVKSMYNIHFSMLAFGRSRSRINSLMPVMSTQVFFSCGLGPTNQSFRWTVKSPYRMERTRGDTATKGPQHLRASLLTGDHNRFQTKEEKSWCGKTNFFVLETFDNLVLTVSTPDNLLPAVSILDSLLLTVSTPDNLLLTISTPDNLLMTVSTPDNLQMTVSTPDNPLLTVSSPDNLLMTVSTPDNLLMIVSTPDNLLPTVSTPDNLQMTVSKPDYPLLTRVKDCAVTGPLTLNLAMRSAGIPRIWFKSLGTLESIFSYSALHGRLRLTMIEPASDKSLKIMEASGISWREQSQLLAVLPQLGTEMEKEINPAKGE
ncbi:hypothetical protein RRG08_003656 [Elysia crispata]|uniref:Uncharacterized protein n=1 Tax=Elysia crispata TaxID=231223 RepID=A0AAE1E5Q2_9GAST|nr:hypothetical protein RRG08_003656 [Elysia crispata]